MTMKDKIQKTFEELMEINEVFPHEKEVLTYIEKRLEGLDLEVIRDSYNNIIVKIDGVGEPIMLSTHVDIPESAPDIDYSIEGDILKSNGKSILGADPKSGLAVIMELLIEFAGRDHSTHAPIEALLTRGEEAGLHGARNADYFLLKSKMGIVLDEDGPVTQVVMRAPSFVRFEATFNGMIVHPREPEKGVNALQMAAKAMEQIPCGYSTEGVTWNIGIFNSGTAVNSVPGSASLRAELRSFDTELVMSEAKRIEETFKRVAEEFGGSCDVETELEFEGYKLEKDHELFERLDKTFKDMNLTPNYFETFGGTDANVFNVNGIKCVPLGSGYYNAHEYTEYVNLAEMEEIYVFLDKFLTV